MLTNPHEKAILEQEKKHEPKFSENISSYSSALFGMSHCFQLAKKYGIRRPPPYPYILNAAVDIFLKAEFDEARKERNPTQHF